MMTTRLLDEKSIFSVACQIESEEAREAYLAQVCGENSALLERVLVLLRMHQEDSEFLDQPALATFRETEIHAMTDLVGSEIGPYKIRESLGDGGFGQVFVAEQTEPVRRKVALKIIKPGMDTKEVLARFSAEQQALALMDHPNIARVFDAGTTTQGRPFFVMEYVKGFPIVEYCDQQKLSIEERLELFISVCKAVQHAHTKGIIHRDLKPSNIMVSPHDGVPVVKVIDFGIAKAIGQKLTEQTIYTSQAQMIGTPLYMSPEQAEINALDVDIRSDVYSLGVLLYELLTGTTPFDRNRFSTVGFDELRKIIKEEDPPRPSTRLTTLGELLSTVSTERSTVPAKLSALVKGDLDWVVMKSLEKDRKRRYQTANELAEDVQRYLNDELVEARPPSVTYRVGKFARRNRGLLTTATLVFAALLIGTVVSTWNAVVAEGARKKAVAARDEAESILGVLEKLLVDIKPGNSLQWDVSFRTVLDQTAAKLDKMKLEPLVEARIRFMFGDAYLALGKYKKANEQLDVSRLNRRNELGPDHPDTVRADALKSTIPGAITLAKNKNPSKGLSLERALLKTSLTRCRAVLPENDPMTLRVHHAYAWNLGLSGLLEEATRNQTHREESHKFYAESIEEFKDVYERRKIRLGEEHADTLGSAVALARVRNYQGSHKNKEPFQKAVDITTRVLNIMKQEGWPKDHPITLEAEAVLGRAYHWLGREKEGLELSQKVFQGRLKVLGPDHDWTGYSRNWLGDVYFLMDDFEKAEPLLEDVGRGDFLILCKLKLNKPQEAEEIARRELEWIESGKDRVNHWNKPLTKVYLAKALIAQNELDEAQSLLHEASDILEKNKNNMTFGTPQNESNDPILAVRQALVDLYTALDNKSEEATKSRAKLKAWPDEKAKLLAKREAIEQ